MGYLNNTEFWIHVSVLPNRNIQSNLNVPPFSKYWPEDDLVKPKHGAKTMYYWLYIDVVVRLNKKTLY
jgi:hypothetical protein